MSKNNIFFMEIFNDILKINNTTVIIIYDTDGNIWFGLRDILKVIGYTSLENAMATININVKNKKYYNKIDSYGQLEGSKNMLKPNKIFINESGLYEILSKTTKPLAKLFMDKYFTDIMPTIRKTGSYKLHKSDASKLNKINKKLSFMKKSNKSLKINQINIDYPEGTHIYIIKQKVNNKTYYKLGYTRNLNRRIKTYNTGNANKIYFNYIIKVNNIDIDDCIKKILRNKELIKNKEFYKITLKKALDYIYKCDNSLNKIACGYCLKSYNFDIISKHTCNI